MNYVPPQPPPYGAPPYPQGPRRSSTNATISLVMGILGFVCCPVVCSALAIYFASQANKEIALDPSLDGASMAKAGQILGIVGLVLTAIAVVIYAIILAVALTSDVSSY